MSDKRKKLTIYLHPEDDLQDAKAMEVIDSVPLRTRGDFFRAAIVSSCALYELDKRLPFLMSMLYDRQLTPDQVVGIIQQTTGWQPSVANIQDVIAACSGNVKEHKPHSLDIAGGEGEASPARDNFKRMLKKD